MLADNTSKQLLSCCTKHKMHIIISFFKLHQLLLSIHCTDFKNAKLLRQNMNKKITQLPVLFLSSCGYVLVLTHRLR